MPHDSIETEGYSFVAKNLRHRAQHNGPVRFVLDKRAFCFESESFGPQAAAPEPPGASDTRAPGTRHNCFVWRFIDSRARNLHSGLVQPVGRERSHQRADAHGGERGRHHYSYNGFALYLDIRHHNFRQGNRYHRNRTPNTGGGTFGAGTPSTTLTDNAAAPLFTFTNLGYGQTAKVELLTLTGDALLITPYFQRLFPSPVLAQSAVALRSAWTISTSLPEHGQGQRWMAVTSRKITYSD